MTTKEHTEHLRRAAEHVEGMDMRLSAALGELKIALRGLQTIARWPYHPRTIKALQQRALDTLRLIGKEWER